MILKLDILHWELKLYSVNINDDPGLTLTYFTARSNLVTGFSIGKSENRVFSETIEVCELKVGRYRQLIKFMTVCEY